MSTSRSNLKTSLPSAHAASTQSQSNMRHVPPNSNVSRQPERQPPNKPGADPRHLAIALHHAHRIQAQKDTESLILDRILELVTFPSSPSADPASPSPEDAQTFKSALIPFQPADYDNLIQERNIEGLCGYGLCPHEHRKDDSRGTYRITWGAKGSGPGGRGREMNIVPREKLEMWCSDECAERALYIRVQLAEEPVWERRADNARGKNLLLLEEGRTVTQRGKGKAATVGEVTGQLANFHMSGTPGSSNLAGDMSKLSVRDGAHFHELALERGDANPALRAGRVDIQIQENENLPFERVTAPEMRPGDDKGGSIEGYVPQEF
ncbi:Rtr1/RPAP2 family-domain-containing protein [Aspergillus coremiiformis]|uniref:RNA polymerase II subunit B1 CTD phosphatase RPAP2 homolog n=1 Tax=Aspergillus coremiiformis TaxID=138285 RepID=A0A5N6Z2Y1_9EURO|nr:Rtr1/RPAP2 family-domain-containing protein [Aspergillus coremiiformis]